MSLGFNSEVVGSSAGQINYKLSLDCRGFYNPTAIVISSEESLIAPVEYNVALQRFKLQLIHPNFESLLGIQLSSIVLVAPINAAGVPRTLSELRKDLWFHIESPNFIWVGAQKDAGNTTKLPDFICMQMIVAPLKTQT